jgi:Protein of unknown function (DUF3631)
MPKQPSPRRRREKAPPLIVICRILSLELAKAINKPWKAIRVPDPGEFDKLDRFINADVVVIADGDAVYVHEIGAALAGRARRIRVLPTLDDWVNTIARVDFSTLVDQDAWVLPPVEVDPPTPVEAASESVEAPPVEAPPVEAPTPELPAEMDEAAKAVIDAITAKMHEEHPEVQETIDEQAEEKAAAEAEEKELIDELARLDPIAYARRRKKAAEDLGVDEAGEDIPVGALDRAVRARREEIDQAAAKMEPPDHGHWIVQPWPEPVDGAELLSALVARILRHFAITKHQAIAVALWIMFAWAHDIAIYSPLLLITSAVDTEGKSHLLVFISFTTPRGYVFSEPTPAGVYQVIARKSPTLCADDADNLFQKSLAHLINSSWLRTTAWKLIGGHRGKAQRLSTWCAKAFGMIGRKMPAATLSRCIIIRMRRKTDADQVEDFHQADDAGLEELRRKCLRWTDDNRESLKAALAGPKEFLNRLGDNWRLQFAIARAAGGEWPALAQEAAAAVNAARTDDDLHPRIQVLNDIRIAFEEAHATVFHSEPLAKTLAAMEGRPWAEWKNGRPITKHQLAYLLKEFDPSIKAGSIEAGGTNLKGYRLESFADAFARCLPKKPASNSSGRQDS